jgi:serine/threonine protein kinase
MNGIGCNFNFANNLSKYGYGKRFVNIYQKNGEKYVVKKENPRNKGDSIKEEDFYKKYDQQIKRDGFAKNINIPLKMMRCENNSVLYVFGYIENDYNNKYMQRISYTQWVEYTIQLCLTVYYLNYVLHIFHNDLFNRGDLWNVMIKQNDKPYIIVVDDFKHTVHGDHIVLIDFGYQSKHIEQQTEHFYNNKWKTRKTYKYKSEVFIVFYFSYFLFFGIDDRWGEKFDDIYDQFVNEFERKSNVHDSRNFDRYVIQSLMDLQKN